MELMEAATMPRDTTGFKRTEAGVIPEDWQALRLSDCITVHRGGSPRPIESFITNDLNGVNWIKIGDAEKYGKYIRSTSEKIIPAGVKFSREVRAGDFLLSNSMSFGRPYILAIDGCIHDGWLVLQNYQATFDKDFLYYTLSDRYLLDQYQAKAAGSGVLNLNKELIGTVHLRVPPLPEQRAIATALSDVDGLLAGLDALIAKKKALKQGAMQQLLTGKQRLPGFKGEWVVRSFGELFDFSGGFTASRDQLSSKGHPYLHYGDIHLATSTTLNVETDFQRIPKLDVPLNQVSSRSLLRDGDIVFVDASEDDNGVSKHVVIRNPKGIPFISGLHTIVAKSKDPVLDPVYSAYCFQTEQVKRQFRFYAVGTKVSGISKSNIALLELPIPSIEEQRAIGTILSHMDAELAALEARRAKTALLKQGMMQELLTGRTRLV